MDNKYTGWSIYTPLAHEYEGKAVDFARKAMTRPVMTLTKEQVRALEYFSSPTDRFLRSLLSDKSCWGTKPIPDVLDGFFNRTGKFVAAAKHSLEKALLKLNVPIAHIQNITYPQLANVMKRIR